MEIGCGTGEHASASDADGAGRGPMKMVRGDLYWQEPDSETTMAIPLKIDFVSDVSCPWCVIGLGGLETALERIGGEIDATIISARNMARRRNSRRRTAR
jgi:hypothetical protein